MVPYFPSGAGATPAPLLLEAKKRKRRTLAEISLEELPALQHVAMARLHLKFTGDTHGLLAAFLDKVRAKMAGYVTDDEGHLNPLAAAPLQDFTATAWREMFGQYEARLEAARRQAALISFAALARYHQHYLGLVAEQTESHRLNEADPVRVGVVAQPFYRPQLEEVLTATKERVYSDGFKLSGRVWNLDEMGRKGIQQIILSTIANGDSAWDAAKRLESHLGMGQQCPRWTRQRLFGLTKTDIAAGDSTGLISGSPCKGKGVAYKSLRLARNEIQIAHAAATDAIFARMPWVEQEQIVLSPSHPPISCECEGIASGGENGDGVYPKGTIALPLHCQCLCHKAAVLMKDDAFVQKMRGWLGGQSAWPEMDTYATWAQSARQTLATALEQGLYEQLALPLLTWLDGDEKELDAALGTVPEVDPATKALTDFGRRILTNRKFEECLVVDASGNKVLQKSGGIDYVSFTEAEVKKIKQVCDNGPG